MPSFKHFDLKIVTPHFDSELTDLIIHLDHLRRKEMGGTTNAETFFQLKNIFHFLESMLSARIEGNRTTVEEYVEVKIGGVGTEDEGIQEIANMEEAMSFIDSDVANFSINKMFVSELHKKVVKGLSPSREGDPNPGEYRKSNLKIAKSNHVPPDYVQVPSYMDELFNFINQKHPSKYDLLKTFIVHHRFEWVHPFKNGNGRTGRLITYAMLVKDGFNIEKSRRIINPSAVFCLQRDQYYENLSKADTGDEEGCLAWCLYVLKGLKNEIEKVDKLSDYSFLKEKILLPTVQYSLERKHITDLEAKVLKVAVEKQIFRAADIKKIMPDKHEVEISRLITKLKNKKMIVPIQENARSYLVKFDNNFLLRGIITYLKENNFINL